MADQTESMDRSGRLAKEVSEAYARRLQSAQTRFTERLQKAVDAHLPAPGIKAPWEIWQDWFQYSTDFAQRSVMFWDTLRRRGNNYVEHEQAGKPPLLHFDYEIVSDGRERSRPVNYALVRIVPPEGVTVDPKRRPYVIIDPRAGHGPGIGGFKDDSQVGVALEDGHPVYFVIFFPEPEPDQTLLDVCDAERDFIHVVRERHPDSAAPVVVGNCQGGWAAMMLASSAPEDTGPVVINGAPLSYWGGAWSEGAGDNPMRYTGGLLGGSWLASLAADLGAGTFDGAGLVQNFENLNPANTFWTKYYNLFSRIDTERERFLDFERWWGGFYLLTAPEIEWIVQNLFVGNKLAAGGVQRTRGEFFDLRAIRSPIIVFASMGDNITPPQQAFNWIADLYGSTDEIKARGQVIVGLLHDDVGHLGIFVSGRVARREHKQIVSVLKSIEALPPGLWGMEIQERQGPDGHPVYEVEFTERRLEDIVDRLNRYRREDEQAFEAVAAVSEFNQRAYDLFVRPVVRNLTDEKTAELGRQLNPMRSQRWGLSDLNPFTWWLGPVAEQVEQQREELSATHPLRQMEKLVSESVVASLDLYRDLRDATSEALFFMTYGNIFLFTMADRALPKAAETLPTDVRELPWVKEALAAIDRGGYPEAVARAAVMLRAKAGSMSLSRVQLRQSFRERYADILPDLSWEELRLLRGQQELIVTYEPDLALETLPSLLSDDNDRARFLRLLDRVQADPELPDDGPEQAMMFDRIRGVLGRPPGSAEPARSAPTSPPPSPTKKTTTKKTTTGKTTTGKTTTGKKATPKKKAAGAATRTTAAAKKKA